MPGLFEDVRRRGYPFGMNGFRPRFTLGVMAIVAGILAAGCAGGGADAPDPMTTLSSSEASKRDQRQAIESIAADLESGDIDRTEGREALKKYAWRRGAPNDIRMAAIAALLNDDPDDTARMLALMLPTETDWEIIGRVSELASERSWTQMAPALVRSWSRPVLEPADADRPERAALDALFPNESVEATVYRVFSTPQEDRLFGERARMDAWALLQRIDDDGSRTKALLAADTTTGDGDALLADLLAGARELRVVPRTSEQLEWLLDLRKPEHRAFWESASAIIVSLSDEQLHGFALRHLSGVQWASVNEPSWLDASREELLSRLDAELEGRRRYQRTDGLVDFTGDQRETLSAWRDRLVWGDALLLLIAAQAVETPALAVDFYEQATRDQSDRSTEYGGVLGFADDRFFAALYPPRPAQRLGDRRFVASPELLTASATALFHYHFHAQDSRNVEYAGPGRGDLEYADRFGRACIVLTFVNQDALNADYYQPGGGRIDLGEVARPR